MKPGGLYKVRFPLTSGQKELNNTNIEQGDSVWCDTRVGSTTKEIKEDGKKLIFVD